MNTLRNFCNEQGADRTFSVIDAQKMVIHLEVRLLMQLSLPSCL